MKTKGTIIGIIFSVVFALILIPGWDISAGEKIEPVKKKWFETLNYPITPEDEEWAEYSLQECIEILNPPDEILKNMSTEDIVRLLVEYPYSRNSIIYSTEYQYFSFLEKNCNLFTEWLKREDSYQIMIEYLNKHSIDYTVVNKDGTGSFEKSGINNEKFIYKTLSYYWNNLDKDEKEYLNEILDKKGKEYTKVNEFASNELLLKIDDIRSNFDKVVDGDNKPQAYNLTGFWNSGITIGFDRTGESNYVYYCIGTYGKYATTSPCLKYSYGELDKITKSNINSEISSAYPSWIYLSTATGKYNCHSYAWISSDTSNTYWLDDPSSYCDGPFVTYKNTNGNAQTGDKIVIYAYNDSGLIEPVHSVVVKNGGSYLGTIRVTSKLGAAGLYTTTLSDMLELYSGVYYKVYR